MVVSFQTNSILSIFYDNFISSYFITWSYTMYRTQHKIGERLDLNGSKKRRKNMKIVAMRFGEREGKSIVIV